MKVIANGNNPHVVNMIGAVTRQEPMCVVTEFLEHGDLLSYLKTSRKKVMGSVILSAVGISCSPNSAIVISLPKAS